MLDICRSKRLWLSTMGFIFTVEIDRTMYQLDYTDIVSVKSVYYIKM